VVVRFGVSHALLADHDGVLRLVADVLAAIKKESLAKLRRTLGKKDLTSSPT
jgi:hypothetical protein